jgi:FkbM family methyltransferase
MLTQTVDGWVLPAESKPPRVDSLPWERLRRVGLIDRQRPALVDIGANVGFTTIPPLAAGDVARVYAVEPDPGTFACLEQNVRSHGLADRVVATCCAVADFDGTAPLYRATAPTTRRLLAPHRRANARKLLPVPVHRLDTLVEKWRVDAASIGWIKVDVQGWESRVLDGAPALAAERGIVWLLEISPKHLEAAGTPLAAVVGQFEQLFSHALDLRRSAEPMPTRELAANLGYLGQGADSYTDLLLFHR